MPDSKCPTCGRPDDTQSAGPASNSERELTLKIPEHHWPIFKIIFHKMNIKFGMEGLGEFANLLPAYGDQIPLDRSVFRYFDDTIIAYVFLALERGYRVTTRTEPGGKPDYNGTARVKVFADLHHPGDDEVRSLEISDCAYDTSAATVCAYLEEASARFSPL